MPGVEAKIEVNHDMDIDKENGELLKELLRPADIKEDVKLMEQRKRVTKILHSEAFHKELDKILDQQMKEGSVCGGKAGSGTSAAIAALQEISNLLLPQAKLGCSVFNRGATMPIIPINDVRNIDNIKRPEKLLRCKLASVYRLIDLHGWASGMQLHSSIRLTRDSDYYLTSCHGLMNHEVQASNLTLIDIKGENENNEMAQIDYGTWLLHAAIHKLNDPNSRCVIFVKTPAVVAVSCMKSGLMKLCEDAIKLGQVNTYSWGSSSQSDVSHDERIDVEQKNLQKCLDKSHCILIRNVGLLARGKTIEEVWQFVSWAVQACEIQVRLTGSLNSDSLITVQDKIVNQYNSEDLGTESEDADYAVLHYEGLMRLLDATGHRTGHIYRHAPITIDRSKSKQDDGNLADKEDGDEDDDEDVEVPPSATSFSTQTSNGISNNDTELCSMKGPQQPKWLVHMPNDYVREEIEEPSRGGMKTTVTWKQLPPDSRQSSGLVETCTSANQFAPLGSNPNELKMQQMKVKAKYFTDETTAGHKSKVFRAMEESVGSGGDQADKPAEESFDEPGRTVMVGAVSKGIIDKKHRQDPSVYNSYFSPNPFDRVTEEDLRAYERKVLGLPDENALDNSSPQPPDVVVSDTVVPEEVIEAQSAPKQVETIPTSSSHTAIADEATDVPSKELPTSTSEGAVAGSTLSPTPRENVRSDTSGADMSHDDTEKEGNKSATGGKKKKKKFKDMFSFRKKDKANK